MHRILVSMCLGVQLVLTALSLGQTTVSGLVTDGYWNFSESTSSLSKPKQISVGIGLMVLRNDGSVYSSRPQLSRDRLTKQIVFSDAPGFDIPEDLPSLIAIAAGNNASIGLKPDGKVVTWGRKTLPIEPPTGLDHVVKVASGGDHLVALKDDGSVAAWGSNANGQCDLTDALPKIIGITALPTTTILVAENGKIIQVGKVLRRLDQAPGDPEPTSSFTRVSAGGGRFVALRADGSGTVFDPWVFDNSDYPYYRVVIPPSPQVRSFCCDIDLIAVYRSGDSNRTLPANVSQVASSVDGEFTNEPEVWTLTARNRWILTADGVVIPYQTGFKYPADYPPFRRENRSLDRLISLRSRDSEAYGLKLDGTIVSVLDGLPIGGPLRLKDISLSPIPYYFIPPFTTFYRDLGLTLDGRVVAIRNPSSIPANLKNIVAISAESTYGLAIDATGNLTGWNFDGTPFTALPNGLSGVKQIEQSFVVLKDGTVRGINVTVPDAVKSLREVSKIQRSEEGFFALRRDGTIAVLEDSGRWSALANLSHVADIYAKDDQVATKDQQGYWKLWTVAGQPMVKADQLAQIRHYIDEDRSLFPQLSSLPTVVGFPDFGVQFVQAALAPGRAATGQLWLSRPAPPGGRTIALSCDDRDVFVPTSVTVRPGSREATFRMVAATSNRNIRPVIVTARLGSTTKRSSLLISKPIGLSVSQSTLVGGSEQRVTLTLTLGRAVARDATYSLTYSDPILRGPSVITVPANQSSASVQLSSETVPAKATAVVTVSRGEDFDSREIFISPPKLTLRSDSAVLAGDPMLIKGMTDVKVNREMVYRVQSSAQNVVKDFEVTIPGFATEGSATVMTDAPGSNVALSVNSHVLVAVTVYGMKKASMPDSVIGYTTHATLTVECPPKKDRVIYLQGSGGFDQLPSTVKLRKGEDSVDIYYRVALDASGPLHLTLSSEHLGSRTCSGKVLLGKVKSVFLTRTVRGGSTDELSLSVELLDPTRTDIEFPLVSSDPSTVAVPPTLKFSTGARTAKISLKHFAVKADKDVGITLLVGDLKFNKTVTVTQ